MGKGTYKKYLTPEHPLFSEGFSTFSASSRKEKKKKKAKGVAATTTTLIKKERE